MRLQYESAVTVESSQEGEERIPRLLAVNRNKASFFHRLTVGLRGRRRKHILPPFLPGRNRAIGAPDRLYARCIPARSTVTGNTLELAYGKIQHFARVPPILLDFHSRKKPLTFAEVTQAIDCVAEPGVRVQLSWLELTFDTQGYAPSYLLRHLFTPAHHFKEIYKARELVTFYAGSTCSAWELRVYRKSPVTVRIEFILRRPFLRKHGILSLEDLCRLRTLDLWTKASFKELADEPWSQVLLASPKDWRRDITAQWPNRWALQLLMKSLRGDGTDTSGLLGRSAIEGLLREMQPKLIW